MTPEDLYWAEDAHRLELMAAAARSQGAIISTAHVTNAAPSAYEEQLGAEAGEGTPDWADPVLWNQAKVLGATPGEVAREYLALGGIVH